MSKRQVRTVNVFSKVVLVAAFVAAAAVPLVAASCHTQVKPDQFVGAVVDCSESTGGAIAESVGQVVQCFAAAGGPSGAAAVACVADLANAVAATWKDAACVIAALSTPDTPTGQVADRARVAAKVNPDVAAQASMFLAANRITIQGAR